MTRQEKNNIIKHYAPVYTGKNNLDVEKTAERIAGWSKEFFGDPALESDGHYHIQTKVPDFHMELYADLMSFFRLYYMTCPSDSGKTTVVSLLYPIYSNVYFNEPHTVLCSRVEDTTVGLLDSIKYELEDNNKFISVYGNLKGDPKVDKRYWRDDFVELTNSNIIRAVQIGGNIRSRKRGHWRITLAIVDDPEELVDLNSPAELKKHWDWIMRSLEKRLDKSFGKLRMVGTRIGPDCCVERAVTDTRWKGKEYRALIDDPVTQSKKSFWEERYPVSFLVSEKAAAIKNNDLESWMYERQNEPPASLKKNLKGVRFHNLIYERRNDQNVLSTGLPQDDVIPVNIYCGIDPAFAQTENADPRALIVFALGRVLKENEIYGDPYWLNCVWVLEYLYNWMSPELIIDAAMNFHQKYFLQGCILEAISGAQLYEPIMTKRLSGDRFFFDHPMKLDFVNYQPKNKRDRIYATLEPKVRMGQVLLRSNMLELIEECEIFHKDRIHLLDALEMGLRMSQPNRGEYKNASNDRQKLARRSRIEILRRQKPQPKKNIGIPTKLSQMGL